MVIEDLRIFKWVVVSRAFQKRYNQPVNVMILDGSKLRYKGKTIKIEGIKKFRLGIKDVDIIEGTGEDYEDEKAMLIFNAKEEASAAGFEFDEVFEVKPTKEGAKFKKTIINRNDDMSDKMDCLHNDEDESIFTIFFDNDETLTGLSKDLSGECKIRSECYGFYETISWDKLNFFYKRGLIDMQVGVIENRMKG